MTLLILPKRSLAKCQELETHNATYAQDAQKVQTKNLSLSDTLRKMQPDLAPFKQQPRTVTPKAAVKEPSAAHSNLRKAYDQISKIANEWHEKANYLPEEERAPYREQVNKYVGDLNDLVYEDDNPRFSEQIIRHNAQVHDDSLERNFKHNSNYEWHNPEADPLF